MGKQKNKSVKIKLPPEVITIINESKQLFQEMYDRTMDKDTENPFIFWHIHLDNDCDWGKINAMRQAGIKEAKIYASYRSGLIPTQKNSKLISPAAMKEYTFYYDEFEKTLKSSTENGKISRLLFVQKANQILNDYIPQHQSYACFAAHDFIIRHLLNKKDFQYYTITNEIDFIGFCMLKLRKDLEGLEILSQSHISENMYPVCRSIFETYIYLSAIRNHKDFFDKYILSQKQSAQKTIKYYDLIFDSSKITNISLKYHASNTPFQADKELFNCFYKSACQFVHLDPFSAKGYFHGSSPYDEIDSCLTIYAIGIALSAFALFEISNMHFCDKQYRDDLKRLIAQIKEELLICFSCLEGDPFYNNRIFKAVKSRLNEINVNTSSYSYLSEDEIVHIAEKNSPPDKLPQELTDMLNGLYMIFMRMYGRSISHTEDKYAHSLLFYSLDDYNRGVINEMRKDGEDEAKIFAYYTTGYFVNQNQTKIEHQGEKKALEAYKLFQSAMRETAAGVPVPLVQAVLKINAEVNDIIKKNTRYIESTCSDFIRRHLESNQNFMDYEIKTEIDFIGFCMKKTQKDLYAISAFHNERMPENMFAITRSIFDTYLYAANISANKDFFRNEILRDIAQSQIRFARDSNGVIKYNSLVFDTGYFASHPSKKDLAQRTLCDEDTHLYDIFYGAFSQFVHLSPLAAKCYFTENEPYFELDSGITAFALAIFCAVIFLEKCIDVNDVKPMYKSDLCTLTQKMKTDLVRTYKLFKTIDPQSAAFDCILKRLE